MRSFFCVGGIAIGVLDGLSVIHREHVFHRDIKPENILMDGQTPKIADLGISRMLGTNVLAETTAGTLYSMSPEILFEEGAHRSPPTLAEILVAARFFRMPLDDPGPRSWISFSRSSTRTRC